MKQIPQTIDDEDWEAELNELVQNKLIDSDLEEQSDSRSYDIEHGKPSINNIKRNYDIEQSRLSENHLQIEPIVKLKKTGSNNNNLRRKPIRYGK